jgi:hypothetical protein
MLERNDVDKTHMMRRNSLLNLGLVFLSGLVSLGWLPGCQPSGSPDIDQGDSRSQPVFYPPAPDTPRLQFLTSFSASSDLGPAGGQPTSRFEKFVFGTKEESVDWIGKPYGIAIDDNRLYVCDVQKKAVTVLNLKTHTFGYLTKERRMINPVNLCVVEGIKYVADPTAGKVFVFDRDNALRTVLGTDLKLKPIDVAVRGQRCYVTDMASNQVVVLDASTGEIVQRLGQAGDGLGQFVLIGDLALDDQENVYVTDKLLGRVTVFNSVGVFQRSFGRAGDSIHNFVRPKGLDVDRAGRLWIVDAAPEVTKVYDADGQLLMFFGLPGDQPGNMNLPASVVLDYDHVALFKRFMVPGAEIEFLVFVTNQYGPKVNVYGFGRFPYQEKPLAPGVPADILSPERTPDTANESANTMPTQTEPSARAMQDMADVYYRSMYLYRNGDYAAARPGLVEVLESGLIPPKMADSIRMILTDIDSRVSRNPATQTP